MTVHIWEWDGDWRERERPNNGTGIIIFSCVFHTIFTGIQILPLNAIPILAESNRIAKQQVCLSKLYQRFLNSDEWKLDQG